LQLKLAFLFLDCQDLLCHVLNCFILGVYFDNVLVNFRLEVLFQLRYKDSVGLVSFFVFPFGLLEGHVFIGRLAQSLTFLQLFNLSFHIFNLNNELFFFVDALDTVLADLFFEGSLPSLELILSLTQLFLQLEHLRVLGSDQLLHFIIQLISKSFQFFVFLLQSFIGSVDDKGFLHILLILLVFTLEFSNIGLHLVGMALVPLELIFP